jgi:O-antigen ligase
LFDRLNLSKTYQFLLVLLAFLIPITVSIANSVIVIIVLLWIFSGNYKSKFSVIFGSKLLISSIIFYFIHVIGMIWTEDISWGFHILHKMWYFILLFPILYTIVEKKYIRYYLYSFLSAIFLTEVVSYLVWFQFIDEFMKANQHNPTPFMSHISYNPILAFSIYLVTHEILFNKEISRIIYISFIFFLLIMVFNMFITGGRAGQVMFFTIIAILCFQYFKGEKTKAVLAAIILVPSVFFAAYQVSPLFKERVDLAYFEIMNYDAQTVSSNQILNSSVGGRILFTVNSFEMVKDNIFFGVGTGDFPVEYKIINDRNSIGAPNTKNPHNMYILILCQLGLFGLISMMSILYFQFRIAILRESGFFHNVGIAMPLLFMVIMFSDSYLLGHFTGLLFIFFSSFLYKDFEKS